MLLAKASATVAAVLLLAIGSPAPAAEGVDLKPVFDEVTFGAGSGILLKAFAVNNSGSVTATQVVVTMDLLNDDIASPDLTFTAGQRSNCTVLSPTRITCPMPDAPAGGSSVTPYDGLAAWVVEADPVPGSDSPQPMPVRVRVSVTAAQTELVPDDNTTTSGSVLRTVRSGPTDWVVRTRVLPTNRVQVGQIVTVEFGAITRVGGNPQGEAIFTYTAPSGTEWALSSYPSTCLEIRPRVEYRCTSSGAIFPQPDFVDFHHWTLKIRELIVGDGEFRAEGMGGELNPADNSARVMLDVEGAPPRPSPSTSGTSLPITGDRTGPWAWLGVTILVAGTALLLVGRRRARR